MPNREQDIINQSIGSRIVNIIIKEMNLPTLKQRILFQLENGACLELYTSSDRMRMALDQDAAGVHSDHVEQCLV
ncbi:MAG: hypothetical protein HQL76_00895 [Magnetococcales bacterium]|nr:hypothetical protein [Magnetococcales bacterium]